MGYLILVEGYMDAIALHQYGFDCAVASLGTALTDDGATLLSRYTDQVVLIYDGDTAGQNATQRAIPMLEKAGLQVKVLKMRDAKDPDEYLKSTAPTASRFCWRNPPIGWNTSLPPLPGSTTCGTTTRRFAICRNLPT